MKEVKNYYTWLIILTLISIIPLLGASTNIYRILNIVILIIALILKFGKKETEKGILLLLYSCFSYIVGFILITVIPMNIIVKLSSLYVYVNKYSLPFQLVSLVLKIIALLYLIKYYKKKYGFIFKEINQTGKVTFKQASYDFILGFFDFKGRTTRLGYYWVGILYGLSFLIVFFLKIPIKIPIFSFLMLDILIISIIPLTTLLARRLRDVGLNNISITILIIINYFSITILDGSLLGLLVRSIVLFLTVLPSKRI